MQGMAFAKHVFGEDPQGKPDYEYIPSAVFSSPPIANVGLSEEEAMEQYKNIDVFTSSYKYAPISLPEPDLAGICCRDTALDVSGRSQSFRQGSRAAVSCISLAAHDCLPNLYYCCHLSCLVG